MDRGRGSNSRISIGQIEERVQSCRDAFNKGAESVFMAAELTQLAEAWQSIHAGATLNYPENSEYREGVGTPILSTVAQEILVAQAEKTLPSQFAEIFLNEGVGIFQDFYVSRARGGDIAESWMNRTDGRRGFDEYHFEKEYLCSHFPPTVANQYQFGRYIGMSLARYNLPTEETNNIVRAEKKLWALKKGNPQLL